MEIRKAHQQANARSNLPESVFCSLFPPNNFTGVDKVQFIKMHSQGVTETLKMIILSKWEPNKKCLPQVFRKIIRLKEHV